LEVGVAQIDVALLELTLVKLVLLQGQLSIDAVFDYLSLSLRRVAEAIILKDFQVKTMVVLAQVF